MKLKEKHIDIMIYVQWALFIIMGGMCIKGETKLAVVFLLLQIIEAVVTRILMEKISL